VEKEDKVRHQRGDIKLYIRLGINCSQQPPVSQCDARGAVAFVTPITGKIFFFSSPPETYGVSGRKAKTVHALKPPQVEEKIGDTDNQNVCTASGTLPQK